WSLPAWSFWAPSAQAAATYPNAIGANWGNCAGYVSMENPYWGNVSGVTAISCSKPATYEIRLTTGFRGFNDIYTTSTARRVGAFANAVVRTSNQPMALSWAPSFWACTSVWANVFGGSGMYQIANACGYYVR
ncbi:MAG TPA: hypothetical protein PKB03_00620, partial [Baekduia sp.]|nr:hypothetical protein [Baekduia sp.]